MSWTTIKLVEFDLASAQVDSLLNLPALQMCPCVGMRTNKMEGREYAGTALKKKKRREKDITFSKQNKIDKYNK